MPVKKIVDRPLPAHIVIVVGRGEKIDQPIVGADVSAVSAVARVLRSAVGIAETAMSRPFEMPWPRVRGAASATAADTVVDAVVLLLYGAVERRRARRLWNAGPLDGLAGRRQIIPIEKMPRRRFAEFWGDVPATV